MHEPEIKKAAKNLEKNLQWNPRFLSVSWKPSFSIITVWEDADAKDEPQLDVPEIWEGFRVELKKRPNPRNRAMNSPSIKPAPRRFGRPE